MDEATDLDRDVDESMRLFQRANVGSSAPLNPIRPSRVLLVLDGSDQDEASIAAAKHLREFADTETLVLNASEPRINSNASDPRLNPDAIPQKSSSDEAQGGLEITKRISGSRPIPREDGDAFEMILSALSKHDVDLVIVPCPFGRAFEKVGTDSAGTVIDVLLSRCATPFLVIRNPQQDLATAAKRISVMVAGENDVETRAASWAFGLAVPGTELTLNLVVEKEHFENVKSLVEAMQPEQTLDVETLGEVLAKTHQSLHGSMTKTANDLGVHYHLLPQTGEAAPPTVLHQAEQQLLVMPLEVDDRFTQGFVIDRIRRSPHPVLVVPGHVPSA